MPQNRCYGWMENAMGTLQEEGKKSVALLTTIQSVQLLDPKRSR